MTRNSNQSKSVINPILRFSLTVSSFLFVVKLLQWVLPFPLILLALLLQVALFSLLGIAVVWSILYLFRQFKRDRVRAFLPVAINAIALVVLLNFPFLKVWLQINFWSLHSAREAVVSLVQSGALKVDNLGRVQLPAAYTITSEGGLVVVKGDEMLFYTFRGIDNSAGFAYIPIHQGSDSEPPLIGEVQFDGIIVNIEKFESQWFWLSTT